MRFFRSSDHQSRKKRHCIELHPKNRHEKSVSTAFKIWIGIYALLIAIGLSAVASPAKSAPIEINPEQAADDIPQLITPDDMQSGGLLFKAREPGRYIEAPKVATDIKLDVTGPVARAIVTQKFVNPGDGWLEGLYVFPLPDDAAVDGLKMKIGDRLIEGIIKPRQEAREIYEKAKQEGKKASLLEQHRPNLFTNAVANIGPKESITIQIEYQQSIPRKDEEFSLRVPLVVAPRYNPRAQPMRTTIELKTEQTQDNSGWGSTDPVPDREEITAPVLDPEKDGKSNPVTLSVHLKAGFPLDNIVSHYHDVSINPGSSDQIIVTLKNEAVPADKDFLLTWTGKPGKTPNLGLFTQISPNDEDDGKANKQTPHPDGSNNEKTTDIQKEQESPASTPAPDENGENYLLAYITPPYKLTEKLQTPPREVIFVIDQSGSMAGPSIRQARASLIEALGQLKPEDKFQIIRFNNSMSKLFPAPQKANKNNVGTARYWVAATNAEGGTEMLPAMQEALKDKSPDATTLRQVIFLTDGAIGNERQLFEEVKSHKGRSRIFTVGIGSAPNSFFMSRAAEVGRGTFTNIGDITEVKSKMEQLFTQLTSPVATDLSIELPGSEAIEASPNALPDLYRGEPVTLAIRARKLGDKLILRGRFDNQPWSMTLDISKAAPSKAIDKLWARGKIRQLENERLLAEDPAKSDKAIETLGLDHHLVTRLTSLVAVDVTPARPEGEELNTRKVPLNLPDGWQMDKVFGPETEQMVDAMVMAPAPQATSPATTRKGMDIARFMKKAAPMLATNKPTSSTPPSPMNVAAAYASQQQIKLPKTGTRSNLLILTGILILALAGILRGWSQWRQIKPGLR